MLLCALAMYTANAQRTWQHELTANDRIVRFTDGVDSGDGLLLVATLHLPSTFDMQGSGVVQRLSSTGALISSRSIWSDSLASPFVVIPSQANDTFEILGDYGMNGGYGGFRVRIDSDLNGVDSTLYPIPDAVGASLDNSIRTTGGDLIIPLFFSVELDNPHASLLVIRAASNGDSISSVRFDTSWILIARAIIETLEGSIIIACGGAPELPEYDAGFVSYIKFNPQLMYSGGFSGPRVDGSAMSPNFQNTLYDQQALLVLESGHLLVGGKIGSLSSGHKGAVQKMTVAGQWLGSVVFDTPYHNDHPAILRNLTRDQNGNLLFAMVANFESGPPSPFLPDEPSRVHIYKLDTALNVLCTNVIDGFAENAYYFVDRIIATHDGGYLLVGSRVDLNDPEQQWVGWARKFGPDDCFTGLEEQSGAPLVSVAPNPGTDELRITLNGPDRRTVATLVDLNGRTVVTEPLRSGQARIATHGLAAGVYGYIIADGAGNRIASGRWVKE